ncbi:MAG: DUF7743 domain-containing protein [Candidatus Kariarchaeaceae archaeon]
MVSFVPVQTSGASYSIDNGSHSPTNPTTETSVTFSASGTSTTSTDPNAIYVHYRQNAGSWSHVNLGSLIFIDLEEIFIWSGSYSYKSLPSGDYEYYFTDDSGGTSSTRFPVSGSLTFTVLYEFTIDAGSHSPSNPLTTNAVTFSASGTSARGSNPTSMYAHYRLGSGSWVHANLGTISFTPLTDTYIWSASASVGTLAAGSYNYYFTNDAAGSSSERYPSSGVNTFIVNYPDTTPPTITNIQFLPNPPDNTETVTVTASIYDSGTGVSLTRIFYSVNGVNQQPITMSLDFGTIYEGLIPIQSYNSQVVFHIEAGDNAGNGRISPNYSYRVRDGVKPIIGSITRTPGVPVNNLPVTISAIVTDNHSGVQSARLNFRYNSGNWASIPMIRPSGSSWSADISVRPYNTLVEYYITATDNHGNAANPSPTFGYIVGDGIEPTINLVNRNPSFPGNTDPIITISVTATDQDSGIASVVMEYAINHTEWVPVVLTLDSGSTYIGDIPGQPYGNVVTFQITVTDNAGNSYYRGIWSIRIEDDVDPIIHSVSRDIPNPDNDDVVTIIGSVSDVDSGIDTVTLNYRFDSGEWQIVPMIFDSESAYNATIPVQLFNAYVEYYVLVTDSYGNTNSKYGIPYTVGDAFYPVINSVSHDPTQPDNTQSIIISSNVADADSGISTVLLYYKIDAGNWASFQMSIDTNSIYKATIPLQDYDSYVEYYISVEDNYGNLITSRTNSFTVADGAFPEIEFVDYHPHSPDETEDVQVRTNASDVGSGVMSVFVYYRLDTGPWQILTMSLVWGITYDATIPQQPYNTLVEFYINATDNSGNVIVSTTNLSYVVGDGESPSISNLNHSPETPTQIENTQITVTVVDVHSGVVEVSLYYRTNTGDWQFQSMSYDSVDNYTAQIPNQQYNFLVEYYVSAIDNNGNTQFSETNSYRVKDGIAPEISNVLIIPEIPHNSDNIEISADVNDADSGVSTVYLYYKVDDGTWFGNLMTYTSGLTFVATLPTQTYNSVVEYYIEAEDNQGNLNSNEISSFTISDIIRPIINSLSHSPISPNSEQTITVTADASDADSGVSFVTLFYRVDGGSWMQSAMLLDSRNSYTSSISAQPADSMVEYYTNVSDNAGNFAVSLTKSYTVSATETSDEDPTSDEGPGFLAFGIFVFLSIISLASRKSMRRT